ncbi:RNA pyrophosphohydrolase (plasmid) [Streptomyces xanthophaeus]|uniref:NUDIX domain-containing protein n=1 Tax=Streptomyces xanthophaeus TaxID=67385 RepID=UPI00233E9764|nr:NUDIX domain-containing protein [Streptomyces xanthophaeus]WCD91411.1 RNA pyrophosphohydrolase [Streptomyces xanthophaeus]
MMNRPAARVICLDAAYRILLLRWRDPLNGTWAWGPPGGGMEPGETPLATARRELVEETGLDPAAVLEGSVPVELDALWNGKHYLGTEQFFLAHFAGDRPPLVRTGLLPYEQASLHKHAWVAWSELDSLPDPVVPPGILAALAVLMPEGPWSERDSAA